MILQFVKWTAFASLLGFAGVASAQTVLAPSVPSTKGRSLPTNSSPRGLVSVAGGYRVMDASFSDNARKQINAEVSSFSTDYKVKSGMALDVSAGVAIWRGLGVKFGLSTYGTTTPGTFSADIPHPFFFNRPRSVTGQSSGLERKETAVDLHIAGIFATNRQIILMAAAGPTLFNVKQDFVTDFTYLDSYPYDSATFGSVSTRTETASKMGFGAGATVGIFLTKVVGVAATAQFATAQVAVQAAGTSTSLKLGGFRGTIGFAARF